MGVQRERMCIRSAEHDEPRRVDGHAQAEQVAVER
jgi:hypothetical protein